MSQDNRRHTGRTTIDQRRKAKKETILANGAQKRKPLWLISAVCAAIIGIGIYTAFQLTSPAGPAAGAAAASPQPAAGIVTYPVGMFEDGIARYFELAAGGTTVKYFILKSSDGVIRAAFDACDVCWPAGKGYYQQDDEMVCRNCGRRFASVLVNQVQGGCNPAPLQRRIQGDRVVIETADILREQRYFNFSGGA